MRSFSGLMYKSILNLMLDKIMKISRKLAKGTTIQNWGVTSFVYAGIMRIRGKGNKEGDFEVIFRGARLYLEPCDITILPTVISGEYEAKEIDWLVNRVHQNLKLSYVFIDVGANAGLYSLVMAKILGPGGRIFAIEPYPRNVSRLRKNIEANLLGSCPIEILEVAVSDTSGQAHLALSKYSGLNRISNDLNEDFISVDIHPLDLLMSKKLDKSTHKIIKIDVEGHESFALRGAMLIIETYRPDLIIEVLPYGSNLDGGIIDSLLKIYKFGIFVANSQVIPYEGLSENFFHSTKAYGNLVLFDKNDLAL